MSAEWLLFTQFSRLIIINSRVLSVCRWTDPKHGLLDALHKQRRLSDSLGILIISLLLRSKKSTDGEGTLFGF